MVDDVDACRLTTKWFLESVGYTVVTARSAEEALARFNPTDHDAIVTDNSMPGLTGAAMASVIRERSPSTILVLYSGTPPQDCHVFDLIIRRPTHLLVLKEGLDQLMSRPPKECEPVPQAPRDLPTSAQSTALSSGADPSKQSENPP